MEFHWKFWKRRASKNEVSLPDPFPEIAAKIEAYKKEMGYFYGGNVSTTATMDMREKEHQMILTQIALFEAQYRALADQKKYADIQEKATVATKRATVLMAIATAVIAAATVEQCHIVAKTPIPNVQPATLKPSALLPNSTTPE